MSRKLHAKSGMQEFWYRGDGKMDFKQIEAFVNVIKYKSFSKAAEATFLTQPTISTHISALEKELGVTLIDRMGKESRPTKQGRAFYNYAINLLHMRERAIDAMCNSLKDISGEINIKASSIPGEHIVPQLIAEFHERYPRVTFFVEQSDSDKVWNDIMDNMGDVGFTGDYRGNELKCELLLKDSLVLITPKNDKFKHIKEEGNLISPKAFYQEEFVWREEGSATRKSFEDYCKKMEPNWKIKTTATVNNLEAVKKCVSAGLGVSVISKIAAEEAEAQDYFVFEIDEIDFKREFYFIYNKNITLTPAALKFKEFILDKKFAK